MNVFYLIPLLIALKGSYSENKSVRVISNAIIVIYGMWSVYLFYALYGWLAAPICLLIYSISYLAFWWFSNAGYEWRFMRAARRGR